MDQDQIRPIESLKSEAEIVKRGIIDASRMDQGSEIMDSAITPVLELLYERMKHLEINASKVGREVGLGITDLEVF